MEPMKPMKPMQPMAPMSFAGPWWPSELGEPSSAGSQNGMRYAFFPKRQRLLVEQDGQCTTYDSGDHRINGIAQQNTKAGGLAFSDERGSVRLDDLNVVG